MPALDKRRMRASFEHAADTYDAAAVLQREIADRLLERLDVVRLKPRVILDIGCGTGYDVRELAKRYPRAHILGLDIAETMARRARGKSGLWNRMTGRCVFSCGDAERLPLAPDSVDMIVSNLTLQWCDPRAVFAEAGRVLRPGGTMILIETLGTGRETPEPPGPVLAEFYRWLVAEHGFSSTYVRTDCMFASPAEAASLTRFFFGSDLSQGRAVIPECTGIWWRTS